MQNEHGEHIDAVNYVSARMKDGKDAPEKTSIGLKCIGEGLQHLVDTNATKEQLTAAIEHATSKAGISRFIKDATIR